MPVLDPHVHCFSGHELPDEFLQARLASLRARRSLASTDGELLSKMRLNMADPDGTLLRRDLESAGVDGALIIGLDWGLLGTATEATHPRAQLEWARSLIAGHGSYFRFVLGIDPRRSDAEEVLLEAAKETWVVGFKLYPPVGFLPTDPACDVVYRSAIEQGRFVMSHTGRQSFPFDLECGRVERYSLVQRRFPDLRLVLAHAGFPFWGDEAIETAVGHPGTSLDVSAWNRLMNVDDAKLDRFLRQALTVLGPARVVFASDHASGKNSHKEVTKLREWRERFLEIGSSCGFSEEELGKGSANLFG